MLQPNPQRTSVLLKTFWQVDPASCLVCGARGIIENVGLELPDHHTVSMYLGRSLKGPSPCLRPKACDLESGLQTFATRMLMRSAVFTIAIFILQRRKSQ